MGRDREFLVSCLKLFHFAGTEGLDPLRFSKHRYDLLVAHKEELGQLITLEQGKPLKEAIGEVDDSILCLRTLIVLFWASLKCCNRFLNAIYDSVI